jgi:hypothetical protein
MPVQILRHYTIHFIFLDYYHWKVQNVINDFRNLTKYFKHAENSINIHYLFTFSTHSILYLNIFKTLHFILLKI